MKVGDVEGEKVGGGEGEAEMVDGIVWYDVVVLMDKIVWQGGRRSV